MLESKQQTLSFIVCHCCPGSGQVRTGVHKLSLSMYPFSISIDEHVPLKFLTKRLRKITNIFTN